MSKTAQIKTIAVEVGLPDDVTVTYHRPSRTWYVQHPLPVGDAVRIGGATIIGNYASVEQAKDKLQADANDFWRVARRTWAALERGENQFGQFEQRLLGYGVRGIHTKAAGNGYKKLLYEGLLDARPDMNGRNRLYITDTGRKVCDALDITGNETDANAGADADNPTGGKQDGRNVSDDKNVTDSDASDALDALLSALERGQPVPPVLLADARKLYTVLTADAKTDATGYTSKLPDVPKRAIPWEQPAQRKAPLYTHEFECSECHKQATVKNYSPKPPKVCSDECRAERKRRQTRERVRRLRERRKSD